jgi:glycosyltransferase involved in cell wall biosynthesis
MQSIQSFSRLKICFLAGTLEQGGAERQLFYMLQALRRRGVAVRVLCLGRSGFWAKPIQSLGVPVTWVGQRQSRLARLVRVFQKVRTDRPDVLQSQHFFANAYVGVVARLLGISGIGAMRNEGTAELRANGPIGGRLNLWLPPFIAANSRLAIQQARAYGVSAASLYFLPNVIDTGLFRPGSSRAERPLTLLSVGRIVKAKAFDRFISALGRLRSELKLDVRGWIAGPAQDKGLRQELEAQSARLGLFPKHLQFLGRISDIGPLYRRADVCVLSSDFEGTPNVLFEAMASGLPVVATKVGDVPAIVLQGETGFVVERDDLDGLTAALAELVRNEPRRIEMGRRARQYVEAHHSLDRLPAYLERLYDLALPQRHPGRRRILQESLG